MKYYLLPYCLKVWLTSVFLGPIIFTSICFFSYHQPINISISDFGSLLQDYFGLVMVGGILSLITWLFFWGVGIVTCRHTTNVIYRKLIMSLMGVILTILTFILLFSGLFSYDDMITDIPFAIVLSYCFCIGAGSLFYDLGLN
jgi:hypothetical protein